LIASSDVRGRVVAVGVNCLAPTHEAVAVLRAACPERMHVASYPNSGEVWHGDARQWAAGDTGAGGGDEEAWAAAAGEWRDKGARLIGGCCRTTPAIIAAIRRGLGLGPGPGGGGTAVTGQEAP
jgi:homocysteine S-methyltransferase